MIDLNNYLDAMIAECRAVFKDRLLYVGLQGSYLRGEANEDSDIDIMVILERFSVQDMVDYRSVLTRIGHSDKSCGFICGRDEIMRWNPMEVLQLKETTKELFGSLSDYLPTSTRQDEINYVNISLCNLYHELCHRFIHANRQKNIALFRGSSKALFFLIQNLVYLETGVFAATKIELESIASAEDRAMLKISSLTDDYDFDTAFASVFKWCNNAFLRLDRIR